MESPLEVPPNLNLSRMQRRLVDCFRIVNPNVPVGPITRSAASEENVDAWQQHDLTIIANTSKGAGGTGKTTTTTFICNGLVEGVVGHGCDVLLINTDSQASLEDRVLGKLLDTVYGGDITQFKQLNGLMPLPANHTPSDLMESLGSCFELQYNFMLRPPKLIKIDVTRLAARDYNVGPAPSPHYAYLVLSSEDIGKWDEQLSVSRYLVRSGEAIKKQTFGAFYSLLKIIAHKLDLPMAVVDMGPGNGIFNRNIIAVSHGFYLPLSADQKAMSNIMAMARVIPAWALEWAEWQALAEGPNRYPLPTHRPKLLGVIFSKIGARGSVRPYNLCQILLKCYEVITQQLEPALRLQQMTLEAADYQAVVPNILPLITPAAQGLQAMPVPVPGVVGLLLDFDQLRIMSERESVPVPFLKRHQLLTMHELAYHEVLAQLAANPNAPLPADIHFLTPVSNPNDLLTKIARIRGMTEQILALIDHL